MPHRLAGVMPKSFFMDILRNDGLGHPFTTSVDLEFRPRFPEEKIYKNTLFEEPQVFFVAKTDCKRTNFSPIAFLFECVKKKAVGAGG